LRQPGFLDTALYKCAFGLEKIEASRKQREQGPPATQHVEVAESVGVYWVQSIVHAA